MRWPWTRRPAGNSAPLMAGAARASAQADAAPSPMGWAFLPPIQRSLDTPIAPVTRPTDFPAELSAWRSPSFTSSLSHAVVDTAPGGIVDGDGGGVGAPTATAGPHPPELTLLPPPRPKALQRSAAGGPSGAPDGRPLEVSPPPQSADDVSEVREIAPEPLARPGLTTAPSAGMPVVHRSVVPDPTPVQHASTQQDPSSDGAEVEPVLEPQPDVEVPLLGADPSPNAYIPADPLGTRPHVEDAAAPLLTPGLPVQRAHPVVQRATDRPRLGLGPPLTAAPGTAVPTPPTSYDERAASGTAPAGDGGFTEIAIQRSTPPSTVHSTAPTKHDGRLADDLGAGPAERLVAVPPPATPPTPGLHLARSVDLTGPDRAGSESVSEPSLLAPTDPPVETDVTATAEGRTEVGASPQEATAPAVVAAPDPGPPPDPPAVVEPPAVLSSAPLPLAAGITTSIQRSSALTGPGVPSPSLVVRPAAVVPSRASGERAVRVQRVRGEQPLASPRPSPGSLSSGSTALTSPTSGSSGGVPTGRPQERPSAAQVQRWTGPVPGAAPAAPVTAPVASRAVQVLPPMDVPLVGDSGTWDGTVEHEPGETSRDLPAPHARPTPVVSRAIEPSAPPVRPLTSSPRSQSSPVAPSLPLVPALGPVVQAAVDESADGPSPEPPTAGTNGAPQVVVQAAEALPPATPPATTSGSGTPGAAGGAGAGGAASATGDVDALAQRLFPSLVRRMKAELLLDRERRGSRTDPW